MKVSDKGRALLTQWEGCCYEVYQDAVGLPTIGVGHLLTKDELASGKIMLFGMPAKYQDGLSEIEVDMLLHQDLASSEGAVNSGIAVDLDQNQFDALCCFVFNVGRQAFLSSTLRKIINAGRVIEAPEQLRRWNKSGGKVIDGLINRRENEIKLFAGAL